MFVHRVDGNYLEEKGRREIAHVGKWVLIWREKGWNKCVVCDWLLSRLELEQLGSGLATTIFVPVSNRGFCSAQLWPTY